MKTNRNCFLIPFFKSSIVITILSLLVLTGCISRDKSSKGDLVESDSIENTADQVEELILLHDGEITDKDIDKIANYTNIDNSSNWRFDRIFEISFLDDNSKDKVYFTRSDGSKSPMMNIIVSTPVNYRYDIYSFSLSGDDTLYSFFSFKDNYDMILVTISGTLPQKEEKFRESIEGYYVDVFTYFCGNKGCMVDRANFGEDFTKRMKEVRNYEGFMRVWKSWKLDQKN